MPDVRHSPWPDDCPRLQLDDLLVDLRFRQLIDGDGTRELSSRQFDLLIFFLAAPGELHSRSRLLESVWAGVVVEDANLSQAIWTLRRALGPARRNWIRTVSKRGYVFQPQCEVRPLIDAPAPAGESASQQPSSPPPSSQQTESSAAPGMRREWRALLARPAVMVALMVLMLCVVGAWRSEGWRGADRPSVIAVIELDRPAEQGGAVWPAALLRALIEWPLSLSPRLQVLSQEQLARDRSDDPPLQLLLVSASESLEHPGRWRVQASLQGQVQAQQLAIEAEQADLPAAVADLAGRVLEQLHVGLDKQLVSAPLSAEQAMRYVQFVRARQNYAWPEAANIGKGLVAEVPEWSTLQLQLAGVLGQLGEVQAARHHLQVGSEQIGSVDHDLQWRMQALAAELEGDDLLALQNYQMLETAYPERALFALETARILLQRGEVADALTRMQKVKLEAQPLWIQVRTALMRSQAMLVLGNAEEARQAAQWAQERAERADWPLEQGQAELSLAAADMIDQRGITQVERYQRAASLFEQGGDSLRALVARMEGASMGSPEQADQALQALLARARQVGHRQLEINALLIAAFRYYRDGDLATFRRLHGEAKAVAEAVGNHRILLRMELDLVGLDLDAGDFKAAEHRLLRVRELGPEGESAFWLEHFAGILEWRKGRYPAAQQRADASLQALHGKAVVQALGYCVRGALAITAGELSRANSEFQRCSRSDAPIYQLIAELGQARVALFAGDRERALRGLAQVQSRLGQVPALIDRRALKLELLDLWVRADALEQAAPLMQQLSSELASNGGVGEQIALMLIKARVALLQGDVETVAAVLEAVAQQTTPEDWQVQSTRRLLSAYLGHVRGHTEQAEQTLRELSEESRRRQDVVMQVEVEVARLWIDPRSGRRGADSLLAESGLRGIRPIVQPVDQLADSRANL